MTKLMLAPAPWRVSNRVGGLVEDACGRPLAWLSIRLAAGGLDWVRIIANKLAAAAEMEAALEAAEGHLKETLGDTKWHPVGDFPVLRQVQAALARARGEV